MGLFKTVGCFWRMWFISSSDTKGPVGWYLLNVSSEQCCWDRTTEPPAAAHTASNGTAWTISGKKRCAFTGSMCGIWGLKWSRTFKNTHCIFWITDHTTFACVSWIQQKPKSPDPTITETQARFKNQIGILRTFKETVSLRGVHQSEERRSN